MLNEVKNTVLEELLGQRAKLKRALEFEYSKHGTEKLQAQLNNVTEQIGSQLEHIRLTSDTELGALLEDIEQGPVQVPAATLGSWIRTCDHVEDVRKEWWMFLAEHGTG